jgi:effector-binding domain-containing protein
LIYNDNYEIQSDRDMQSNEEKVVHKVLDEIQVAQTRIHGKVSNLPDAFAKLSLFAGEQASGNPIVIHHWGVSDEAGHDMDVNLPIHKAVKGEGITTTILPVRDAMTMIHRGPYSEIGNTYKMVNRHTYERGHPIAESTREVFLHFDENHPEETVVEIQAILHDWTHRFTTKLETVLGSEAKEEVLAPMNSLDIDTPADVRQKALCESLSILERKTTDEQQYEILSHCAHVFPVELIPPMRDLFRSTGNVDVVIEAMVSKGGYYPKLLRREGSIIYSEKGPANPTAYKEAKTDVERRRAYCFCPLIRDCIDDTPEIFCNCSAGWPKQLWEGILERPLKIEIVQSLVRGNDTCEFAIHTDFSLVFD